MGRRVAFVVLLAGLLFGYVADRSGESVSVLGQPADGLVEASGELAELAPRDLIFADYMSAGVAPPDYTGAVTSNCRLVRGEGFQTPIWFDHTTLGLDASAPAFVDATFVGFGSWTAVIATDGATVSGTASNLSLNRCPTRSTMIGDILGTLADGSTYVVEVSTR